MLLRALPAARWLAILCLSTALAVRAQDRPDTHRISPAEAEELLRSVDSIAQFAAERTGLELRRRVDRRLASRDEVQRYVEAKMAEDEDQKRFERSELVIKKFGLLPRDFQLQPFLVKILREQVAGYYDSKTKTVNLLDWLAAEAQQPVLAHELTHALQDQAIDLDGWTAKARADLHHAVNADNFDIAYDELSTARNAVLEGQGMAVLVEFMLKPAGHTLLQSPQVVPMMKKFMEKSEPGSIVATAPLLIRESLTFPYRDGLGFIDALLRHGGTELAYRQALLAPPTTSRAILTPESYLQKEVLPPMVMPELGSALAGWEKFDTGSIGQFDVRILIEQLGEPRLAEALSPEWRGGMYLAARPARARGKDAVSDLAFVYVSRWGSAVAAQRFAGFYAEALKRRYAHVKRAKYGFGTREGPITIEASGTEVFVTETFPLATAEAIKKLIRAERSAPPPAKPAVTGDLSLRYMHPIAAVLRPAIEPRMLERLHRDLQQVIH